MKRFLAIGLTLAIIFTLVVPVSAAMVGDTSDGMHCEYVMDGNVVVENAKWMNQGEILWRSQRTVKPDGSSALVIEQGGVKEVIDSDVDYSSFYAMAQAGKIEKERTGLFARAVNVEDSSIFKHTYLAANSVTITRNQLAQDIISGSITIATGAIALRLTRNSVMADLAGVVAGAIAANAFRQLPDQVTVNATTYLVHFVHDGVYYCHCYHSKTTEKYGATTKSYTHRYEAVGG
ncbi:hypothetical protein [Pygmaiobacter massiliensis]|uniref:hypothetical protein n=1 Tax=Pygmaiobacter massiliensis TaxID=1917873 RepID=UPI0011AEF20C|nr:hypothetical protein [Pygmaiobacter massiliensis]